VKVINWSDLSLTDEDLERTLASVKGVNPLRVVSRELVEQCVLPTKGKAKTGHQNLAYPDRKLRLNG